MDVSRANAAFRDAIDHLAGSAGEDDGAALDDFLGRVVQEITALLELPSAVLWQHDLTNATAKVRFMVRDGRVLPSHASGHVSLVTPLHVGSKGWSWHMTRKPVLHAIATNDTLDEAQRKAFAEEGVAAFLNLPLIVRAETLGSITVRVPHGREITPDEMEAAQSLANHAALALLLARRAEESQKAALAVEREEATNRQNVVLKRANEAMRGAVSKLAQNVELEAFLGELLRVMTTELGAVGGGVWLDDERATGLLLTLEGGKVQKTQASAHHGGDVRTAEERERDREAHARGTVIRHGWDDIASLPPYDPHREYLATRGIRTIVSVPMFLGDRHHANITLRFAEDRYLSTEENDLALALADQAALAMELTRLAEEAKKVAVAEERALSAAKRAESLAKANQVLRTSVETLTSPEALDDFLGHVLAAIARLLDSDSATVWTVDQARRASHLRFVIEAGAIVPGPLSSHPDANKPTPFQPSPFMPGNFSMGARPAVVPVSLESGMADEQLAYLTALGVRALLVVPMVLRGEHLGTFTVRLTSDEPLSDEDSELIQALASHATLALQMTKLAEEAKNVAVAREREQAAQERVAELTKANDALARSTAELSAHGDLNAYLSVMLGILLEQMGEDSGTLWRLLGDDTFHLQIEIVGGRLVPLRNTDHPAASAPVAINPENEACANSLAVQARKQVVVYADVATEPVYDADEATRRYLLGQGVRAQLLVPLFSGDRRIGSFVVRSARPRTWTPEQLELAQALGNQAALAVEMDRLAEEAKQAAVAREKEAAAREQVAELTRANAAISRTIDSLAREHSVDAFLATTIAAMAEALETTSMTMWIEQAGFRRLHLVYDDGRTIHGDASAHPDAGKAVAVPAQTVHFEMDGSYRRAPHVYEVGGRDYPWTAERIAYLRALGVRALVEGVMVVDDRVVGTFTARIAEGQPDPTPARLSLVQALTNQAALALEMTRLAEEAKQAAVARGQIETLSRANDALRSVADKLAEEPALDGFLGHALESLVDSFGGFGGGFWRWNHDDVELVLELDRGERRWNEQSEHPLRRSHNASVPAFEEHEKRLRRGEILCFDVERDYGFAPDVQRYLHEAGVGTLVVVPLNLGERHLGRFSIRLAQARALTAQEVELARALGTQASVAIELARLGDEARKVAVARGQVETLTRANRAMHASLSTLTDAAELDGLLRQVMTTVVEHLGERDGGVWLMEHGVARLQHSMEQGKLASVEAHPGADAKTEGVLATLPGHAARVRQFEQNVPRLDGPNEIASLPDYAPYREYFANHGIRSVLSIPLFASDKFLGTVTVRGRKESFPAEDVAFAQALANQASMALHIARLAEQAKQVAIAVEQTEAARRRAETLARANTSIRATLDKLAEQQDLDAFLGEAVAICAEELGAVGAGIWLRNRDRVDDLVLSYEDGVARPVARLEHPGKSHSFGQGDVETQLQRGEIVVLAGAGLTATRWYWAFREYLEARGIVALASLPLFIGDRWIATVVLRHTSVPTFTEEQRELAFALGNQIALALELTRLAEEAKNVAIAREKELAAEARAAKLAEANRALLSTVDLLADDTDTSKLLGHVLLAITKHLGARSSALWVHDQAAALARLAYVIEDGVVKAGPDSRHPNAREPAAITDQRGGTMPGFGTVAARPHATLIADDPCLTAEQRAYLEGLGVRSLIGIPIVIAGAHAGNFTVRLEGDRDPAEEDLEFVQALANQATFALRFAELAEHERRSAVEREQELAAQQRLAELARANAAMRECLDQIAQATDLTELRPTVLGALVKLMGALGGSLWRFDASDGSVTLEQELANGVFHSRDTSGFAHPEKHFYSPDHAPSFEKNQRLIAGEALTMDVATSDMFLLNEREHLLSQGIDTLIVLPIEAAGRHLGRLALAFQGQRALTQSEYELSKALTSQAGLVLEAARLAEQARQTAVAREQEASARARADALARISEAGRSSLAKLAEKPDVDAFLGHILHVCVEQFGAVGAGIWQLHGDGSARLRLSLEDGRVSVAAQSPHPGGLAKDATNFYDHVRLPRGAIVVDDWHAIAARPHFEAFRGYLERHGVRSLVTVPMYLGDVFRGGLTLRFPTDRTLSPVEEGLARSLADQAVLALELTELSEQARSAAVIEERNRIARDIHDSLAQGLAAIIRQLEAASMDPARAESHLSLALDVAQGNLVDARRSIRALRPLALEQASLSEALAAMVADHQPLSSSVVSFAMRGEPRALPSDVETEAYGIAKEALTNATKHGAASNVIVELLYEGSFVQVIIRDNGKGFDLGEARRKGVGLSSIRERAARCGANVTIASEPGCGCEVILFWATPDGDEVSP